MRIWRRVAAMGLVAAGLGSCGDAVDSSEPAGSLTAPVVSTAAAVSTTTSTSVPVVSSSAAPSSVPTLPVSRRCSGPFGSYEVPVGWVANVQPAGSPTASSTCAVIVPVAVAERLGMTVASPAIAERVLHEMETGPWVSISSGPAAVVVLRGIVRDLAPNAEVTEEPSGFRVIGAPASFVLVAVPSARPGLRITRVSYVRATDGGYGRKGSAEDVLLIDDQGATVLLAVVNADDFADPQSGATAAGAAAVLDAIAKTYAPPTG